MKLSIITISLNPGISLERTISSILSQSYTDIEWVVVDGGSTDKTLESYEKVREYISKFVSEPDKGIADAMNKGLMMASGEAVIYMNAGDEFFDAGSLEKMIGMWDIGNYEWVTGGGFIYDHDGKFLYERSISNETSNGLVRSGCRILHAATIIKRSTLSHAGGFSTQFRSSMDYELWLRLICNQIIPQILTLPVIKFYLGGMSGNILRRYSEDRMARRLYGVSKLPLEIKLALIAVIKQTLKPASRVRGIYLIKEWLRV